MSTAIINANRATPLIAPANPASPTANAGHFKPGQSGNPAGRPRGARNRATLAIAALLDEEGPRLLREAIDRALDGDSLLLRCCVTRMVPVPRGRPVELDLAEGSAAGDVVASLAATVRAMAEGAISPLEAADVAEVLEGQRRAIETGDIERRLTRLEEAAEIARHRPGSAEDEGDDDEGDRDAGRGDAGDGENVGERRATPDAARDAPLGEPAPLPAADTGGETRRRENGLTSPDAISPDAISPDAMPADATRIAP